MAQTTAQQRTADAALRRHVGLSLEQWLRAQRAEGHTYGHMAILLARLDVYVSHESLRRWFRELDQGEEVPA